MPASKRNADRSLLLDRLRQRIQRIEGRAATFEIPADNFPETPPENPHEDGGCALPRTAPPPAPPSSLHLASVPKPGRTTDRIAPFRAAAPRPAGRAQHSAWTLGAAATDAMLGPAGLEPGGVHEIKPVRPQPAGTTDGIVGPGADWAAAWGAARAFALALIARRLGMLAAAGEAARPALWCQMRAHADDLGEIYAPGLAGFGITPDQLVIVAVDTARDALWVLEEALRAGSLALVAGTIEAVDLTPARRLALAAQAHATPCLVLTHPQAPAMAATASRWRIAPLDSAPHPLAEGNATLPDAIANRLPGARRLVVGLERLRARPLAGAVSQACVSWCDETFCFHMAAAVRDRADGPGTPRRHTA